MENNEIRTQGPPLLAPKWGIFTKEEPIKLQIIQFPRISAHFNHYLMKDHQMVSLNHPSHFMLGLVLSSKSII